MTAESLYHRELAVITADMQERHLSITHAIPVLAVTVPQLSRELPHTNVAAQLPKSICMTRHYTVRMTQIIPLLTAFGLGSIVTALVQFWLAKRSKEDERAFREKQAAYIGLLEAYHRAAVEGTDETSKMFAYWQMRCELVAPPSVREAIRRIIETNDDPPGRLQADHAMKEAMRTDLGIAK